MNINILILSVIGIVCSLYLFIVEQKVKQNSLYKASCDISDKFSCTKPILTPYSKLFFISNSIMGILFYSTIGLLAILNQENIIFYLSIPACLISVFLGVITYLKIEVLCLVCMITYLVNFLILLLSYFNI